MSSALSYWMVKVNSAQLPTAILSAERAIEKFGDCPNPETTKDPNNRMVVKSKQADR